MAKKATANTKTSKGTEVTNTEGKTVEVLKPGAKKTGGKKKNEPKPEPAKPEPSPFPPVPTDRFKQDFSAKPPFEIDNNLNCVNPVVIGVGKLFDGVAAYLCVSEKDGTFYFSHRIDVPRFTDKGGQVHTPKSFGSLTPNVSPTNIGCDRAEAAFYEAGRDALNTLNSKDVPAGAVKELEKAVSDLKERADRKNPVELTLAVYRAGESDQYLSAMQQYAEAHPSGLIFKDEIPEEEFLKIGLAFEHFDQKLKWMRGDWYIRAKKDFPDAVKSMLSKVGLQTLENEASICRAFPHEKRDSALSFTHYQELAPFAKSERKLEKLIHAVKTDGLSVGKLRKLIADQRDAKDKGGDNKGGDNKDTTTTTTTTGNGGGSSENGAGDAGQAGGGGDTTTTQKADGGDSGANGGASGDTTGSQYEDTNPEPQETKEQLASRKYLAMMDHLYAVETAISEGLIQQPEINDQRRQDTRKLLNRIVDMANKAKM